MCSKAPEQANAPHAALPYPKSINHHWPVHIDKACCYVLGLVKPCATVGCKSFKNRTHFLCLIAYLPTQKTLHCSVQPGLYYHVSCSSTSDTTPDSNMIPQCSTPLTSRCPTRTTEPKNSPKMTACNHPILLPTDLFIFNCQPTTQVVGALLLLLTEHQCLLLLPSTVALSW